MAAVIFDLEGTLVDAEALNARAYARAIAELRPDLRRREIAVALEEPVADAPREAAANLMRCFDLREPALRHAGRVGARAPWQALLRMRLRALEDLLNDPDAVLAHAHPRNVALVREVRRSGRRAGLITTLSWSAADRLLSALGLAAGAIGFVAAREDVARTRPHPEAHLLVAEELGVPPEGCLAVEGSPDGVEAAIAAGMSAVAFTTPLTRRRFTGSGLLERCWSADGSHALCAVVNRDVVGEPGRGEEAP